MVGVGGCGNSRQVNFHACCLLRFSICFWYKKTKFIFCLLFELFDLFNMAELNRTREFIPNDHETFLADISIDERVDQLKTKLDSLDHTKQFVGMKRLGSSYSVVDPFVLFEVNNPNHIKFERVSSFFGSGALGFLCYFAGLNNVMKPTLPLAIKSLACGMVVGYLGLKGYDWTRNMLNDKRNVLFHFALLHEKDFPLIGKEFFYSNLNH